MHEPRRTYPPLTFTEHAFQLGSLRRVDSVKTAACGNRPFDPRTEAWFVDWSRVTIRQLAHSPFAALQLVPVTVPTMTSPGAMGIVFPVNVVPDAQQFQLVAVHVPFS